MTCDIVLTGIGLLSPLGGKESFFRAMGEGAESPCRTAGNASLPPGGLTELLGIKSPKLQVARYLDPLAKNAIVAVEEAMGDAGIAPQAVAQDPYGFGILLAATRGPGARAAALLRAGLPPASSDPAASAARGAGRGRNPRPRSRRPVGHRLRISAAVAGGQDQGHRAPPGRGNRLCGLARFQPSWTVPARCRPGLNPL